MILSTTRLHAPEARPTATVVALRPAGGRRPRREPADPAATGRVLLFTGVRYERLPEPQAEVALVQRRRS